MNTTEGNGQEMKIEKQIFFKKREWNEKKRERTRTKKIVEHCGKGFFAAVRRAIIKSSEQ